MLADYHIHTEFSDDSSYPMEDVIKEAIAKGLDEICFTDHVDYGIKFDFDSNIEIPKRADGTLLANVNYPLYFKTIEELKLKYQNQITIKKGLEFGIQVHTIQDYEKLYKKYPMDFIINSCHQVDDKEFWEQDFQRGKSQKEYNELYYKEIYEVMKAYKDYSVLGHLDHLVRYDLNGPYPFYNIKDIIAEILKLAIKDDKGIEINTSSYRYNLKDTTPSIDILKLYKDLGGKIITIGSDSHNKGAIADHFKETKELLISLGYKSFNTFLNMKPIFHDLT